MEFPSTPVKTISKDPISGIPKSLQGTKEVSRAEALASTSQFFAAVDQRNMSISTRNQVTLVEVHERDNMEVLAVLLCKAIAILDSFLCLGFI